MFHKKWASAFRSKKMKRKNGNGRPQTFQKPADPQDDDKSNQITEPKANHLIKTHESILLRQARPLTHRCTSSRTDLPPIYAPCPRISQSSTLLTNGRTREESEARGRRSSSSPFVLFFVSSFVEKDLGDGSVGSRERSRPICSSGAAAREYAATK